MSKVTASSPASGSLRRRVLSAALAVLLAAAAAFPGLVHAGAYEDFFRAVPVDHAHRISPLLERGLDPNMIEPERGDTGLILALREDAMRVFRLLLDAPGIDLDARAFNGDSALMIACFKGNTPAVELLLARGAQVSHAGWTPLHYAAFNGHTDIARMLLDRSAELDARSPNNTTPLMMAAWGGHMMTVKLLSDAGADATLRNDVGLSAIDFATRHGHMDIAEGLSWRLQRAGKR